MPRQYTIYFCKIEKFQLRSFDIFHIVAKSIDCGYEVEPPRRSGSNVYPKSMFWRKNEKKGIPMYTLLL